MSDVWQAVFPILEVGYPRISGSVDVPIYGKPTRPISFREYFMAFHGDNFHYNNTYLLLCTFALAALLSEWIPDAKNILGQTVKDYDGNLWGHLLTEFCRRQIINEELEWGQDVAVRQKGSVLRNAFGIYNAPAVSKQLVSILLLADQLCTFGVDVILRDTRKQIFWALIDIFPALRSYFGIDNHIDFVFSINE